MSVHPQKYVLRTDSIPTTIEKDFSFAHKTRLTRVEVVQEAAFWVLAAMALFTAWYGLANSI